MNNSSGKILIAYFSHSGNTEALAKQIQGAVGGDLFKITTVHTYPSVYNETTDLAKRELESGFRPELSSEVPEMDSYGVIILGYPNWWGTMPTALFSFLQKYDFSGKTILPFCTHEGSRLGRSVSDLTKIVSGRATVGEGLAVRGSAVNSAGDEVQRWLKSAGLIQ
ncbi:flavodoxin [Deltaproteobacteria bacterium Smac51]|nr:flavodoxin [Deltaproteobacteria bacterium Smac51]